MVPGTPGYKDAALEGPAYPTPPEAPAAVPALSGPAVPTISPAAVPNPEPYNPNPNPNPNAHPNPKLTPNQALLVDAETLIIDFLAHYDKVAA